MQKTFSELMTRENVFLLIISILCLIIIFPYFLPLALGMTLAYLFEPLVDKIMRKFKLKKDIWKWLIGIMIIFTVITAIVGPILTLITTGVQELYSFLSSFRSSDVTPNLFANLAQKVSLFCERFGITYTIDELMDKGTDVLKNASQFLAADVGVAISATPHLLVKFFITILTWSLFTVHGQRYRNQFLPKLIPWEKERTVICQTFSSTVKALIVANVLVSCIQTILITLFLVCLDIPRFALLSVIGFFLSFVPMIGTAPLMIGVAAWCYFSLGEAWKAIVVLVGAAIIGSIDNILRPYFMKGGSQLSFYWIFLAIIGGISQFGLPGVVLGPVCFALFLAAIKSVESLYGTEKEKKQDIF